MITISSIKQKSQKSEQINENSIKFWLNAYFHDSNFPHKMCICVTYMA